MSDISAILAATGATGSAGSTRSTDKNDALSKDAFLRILVAQLQNQDPTQPMEDKDFIAQMAQFSSLEQMQQLNMSYGMSQGYGLLGKAISSTVVDKDGNASVITGLVSGVTSVNNEPYLIVNGNLVPLNSGDMIVADADDTASVLQNAMLLGKTITGTVTAEDGTTSTVTGVVDRVALLNGKAVAYVGDKAVRLDTITEIAD